MNVSGILVVVPVDEVQRTVGRLARLEGVDVHHTDAPTGRIVATIEAPTIEGEVKILQRVKSLPQVILAEMVQHHVDVEMSSGAPNPESDSTPKGPDN